MYSIIAQGQTSVLRKANFMKWINVICTLILFALPAQAANVRYQHTDMLGSVVSESDESGNIISRSQYEPFGKRMGGDKEGIGYTGHLQDKNLGLTYMQARYYDPLIGRFYSNDPIGFRDVHSFNRYAYANNNPYKYVDPDGKAAESFLNRPQGMTVAQNQAAMVEAADIVIEVVDTASDVAAPIKGVVKEGIKQAVKSTLKSLKSTTKVGDRVKTPDNSKDSFTKLKNGQGFKENKTGTIMQKSRTDHTNKKEDGGEWKAGNKPGETPTDSNKTTIAGGKDGGCVLKRDGC